MREIHMQHLLPSHSNIVELLDAFLEPQLAQKTQEPQLAQLALHPPPATTAGVFRVPGLHSGAPDGNAAGVRVGCLAACV